MKTIALTRGHVAFVDDNDYDLVSQFKWQARVDHYKDGTISGVYAYRRIRKPSGVWSHELLHRFLLQVADPKMKVDHQNRNGLDCQRLNLRVCTTSQNGGNSKKQRNNTSGFKGVCWHKGSQRWHSRIEIDGRKIYLGEFRNAEDAAHAYDVAALEHFGDFALLNFPRQAA